jgi:hypothetical protein
MQNSGGKTSWKTLRGEQRNGLKHSNTVKRRMAGHEDGKWIKLAQDSIQFQYLISGPLVLKIPILLLN